MAKCNAVVLHTGPTLLDLSLIFRSISHLLDPSSLTPNLPPVNLLPVNFADLLIASTTSPHSYNSSSFTATFPVPHINAKQRSRADAAEELHIQLHHSSDQSLCKNLSTGKLPFSTLTCSDVTLNRHLRGPCPQCTAGKSRNPPHPPSLTPPTTSVGAVLSFDPQLLPEPSPGLHTHEIILVDEFTGHLSVVGANSKSTPAMFKALQHVIATTYNSNQHRVHTLHGDCEKVNTSLAVPLGSLVITLHTSPPGEHAASKDLSSFSDSSPPPHSPRCLTTSPRNTHYISTEPSPQRATALSTSAAHHLHLTN